MSDLPNRPKPTESERTVIEPTDRVKSVADKENPRFAAARQKADKEERLRAAREKKLAGDGTDDGDETDDAEAAAAPEKKQTFSFNDSTGKSEGGS